MHVSSVRITDNGTINGQVHHVMSPPRYPQRRRHALVKDSHGIPKTSHASMVAPTHARVGMAGQDAHGTSEHCIFVGDGHGPEGECVSASLFSKGSRPDKSYFPSLVDTLESRVSEWVDLLDKSRAEEVESRIRDAVVAHMSVPVFRYEAGQEMVLAGKSVKQAGYVCHGAGSTLALMMFLRGRHRRWTVTLNVGDSEALLVFPRLGNVHVASCSHSWDSQDTYRRYAAWCYQNNTEPRNVCYNRWNDSTEKYKCKDVHGGYDSILMYDFHGNVPHIDATNAEWVSTLHERKNRPEYRGGIQGVRKSGPIHENWGSCVVVDGKACGQNMATLGDRKERFLTRVPWNMVHVYVHEIPPNEPVVGLVQTDGVSNELTLENCYERALVPNLQDYLRTSRTPRDDMSVARAVWR